MVDLDTRWTIEEARALARAGGTRAVVARVLDAVARTPFPEAWITLTTEEQLVARAAQIDEQLDRGADLPLAGVPFAVKDNIDVAGVATTAGCPDFAYVPERSSPVVERLLSAGALLVGKTNLDQFATGLVGTRSPQYGACRNPVVPSFIAGGSSSGSAIVVATGQVVFSLGTDTAGSGRVPAACCGIVGLKPSAGLLPTSGVVPAMPSFDCMSVFTGSGGDAELVLHVARTAAATGAATGATTGATTGPRSVASFLRLGVPVDLEWFDDDDARVCFERAVAHAAAIGYTIVDVDGAPMREAGALLYGSALVAERHSAFGAFVEQHAEVVHPATRAIVERAGAYRGSEVFDALAQLDVLRHQTTPMWDAVDALLLPTVVRVPTYEEACDDLFAPSVELGRYTSFVNPLGMAAVAVPAGTRESGVPFGVSFVGPDGTDDALLAVASSFLGEPRAPDRAVEGQDYRLVVVGAHLSGQPLNHQLTDLAATFVASTSTAPEYRLFALDTTPPKPGLVRAPGEGGAIEVEVWALDAAALGEFVAAIPAPLGVGTIALADGSEATGFLCEPHAVAGAEEITALGGWRAYLSRSS